jgi:3-oxoacyl-[acyl-carrier protein] reductase
VLLTDFTAGPSTWFETTALIGGGLLVRREACAKVVDEVAKELDGLHVLVNNAGISIDGLILRYKTEDLRRVLDVDLASVFHLSKATLRPMMNQRGGSIVNLRSVVGEQGNAGQTAYAAAKAGSSARWRR